MSRLPSNLGVKRMPFFAERGLEGNLNPPKKGIRVLLGILDVDPPTLKPKL